MYFFLFSVNRWQSPWERWKTLMLFLLVMISLVLGEEVNLPPHLSALSPLSRAIDTSNYCEYRDIFY